LLRIQGKPTLNERNKRDACSGRGEPLYKKSTNESSNYLITLHKIITMKALIVKPKDPAEIKFVSELLKKLGIASKQMEWEELEDYGMSVLMKDVDRSKKISRESVMKKLQ
jgi:hypothetical protein